MHCSLEVGEKCFTFIDAVKVMQGCSVRLNRQALARVENARRVYLEYASRRPVYGFSTGVGALQTARRSYTEETLLLEHAAGVGRYLPQEAVRIMLLVRLQQLLQGHSPVRPVVVERLAELLSNNVLPAVPVYGSVGASGDLAPLAHLALVLTGRGRAFLNGKVVNADYALRSVGLEPLRLETGEALSLINGTAYSVAVGLYVAARLLALLLEWSRVIGYGLALASRNPEHYQELVVDVKKHPKPPKMVKIIEDVVKRYWRSVSKRRGIQDPYSLRCTPMLLQSIYAMLKASVENLLCEACSPSDNPIVVGEKVVHQCGFHGITVAASLDTLALLMTYAANAAERRIAQYLDALSSNPFLGDDKSPHGLMIAHYTAASLTAELRSLAAPRTVHSIPTSGLQEDFVSMSAPAATRLLDMIELLELVAAIEAAVVVRLAQLSNLEVDGYGEASTLASRLGEIEVSQLITVAHKELKVKVREVLAAIAKGELPVNFECRL